MAGKQGNGEQAGATQGVWWLGLQAAYSTLRTLRGPAGSQVLQSTVGGCGEQPHCPLRCKGNRACEQSLCLCPRQPGRPPSPDLIVMFATLHAGQVQNRILSRVHTQKILHFTGPASQALAVS